MLDSWAEILRIPRVLLVAASEAQIEALVISLRQHVNAAHQPPLPGPPGQPPAPLPDAAAPRGPLLYIPDMPTLDRQSFPEAVVPPPPATSSAPPGAPVPPGPMAREAAGDCDLFGLQKVDTELLVQVFRTGGVLCINCDNFAIADLESLNSLLDYSERRFLGQPAVPGLHVVCLVTEDAVQSERHTCPFYERFHAILPPAPRLTRVPDPVGALVRPCAGPGARWCVDLKAAPQWPQLLLGAVQVDAVGRPQVQLGPLTFCCHSPGPPLCLHNLSPGARAWLSGVLQDGHFRFHGRRYRLPGPPWHIAVAESDGAAPPPAGGPGGGAGPPSAWGRAGGPGALPAPGPAAAAGPDARAPSRWRVLNYKNFYTFTNTLVVARGRIASTQRPLFCRVREAGEGLRVTTPLDEWQWRTLRECVGRTVPVALAAHAACLDRVAPGLLLQAEERGGARPLAFNPKLLKHSTSGVCLIETPDVPHTVDRILLSCGASAAVYHVSDAVPVDQLLERVTIEHATVRSAEAPMLAVAARARRVLVLCGLDAAPELCRALETLLQTPPYVYVNGAWREVPCAVVAVVQNARALALAPGQKLHADKGAPAEVLAALLGRCPAGPPEPDAGWGPDALCARVLEFFAACKAAEALVAGAALGRRGAPPLRAHYRTLALFTAALRCGRERGRGLRDACVAACRTLARWYAVQPEVQACLGVAAVAIFCDPLPEDAAAPDAETPFVSLRPARGAAGGPDAGSPGPAPSPPPAPGPRTDAGAWLGARDEGRLRELLRRLRSVADVRRHFFQFVGCLLFPASDPDETLGPGPPAAGNAPPAAAGAEPPPPPPLHPWHRLCAALQGRPPCASAYRNARLLRWLHAAAAAAVAAWPAWEREFVLALLQGHAKGHGVVLPSAAPSGPGAPAASGASAAEPGAACTTAPAPAPPPLVEQCVRDLLAHRALVLHSDSLEVAHVEAAVARALARQRPLCWRRVALRADMRMAAAADGRSFEEHLRAWARQEEDGGWSLDPPGPTHSPGPAPGAHGGGPPSPPPRTHLLVLQHAHLAPAELWQVFAGVGTCAPHVLAMGHSLPLGEHQLLLITGALLRLGASEILHRFPARLHREDYAAPALALQALTEAGARDAPRAAELIGCADAVFRRAFGELPFGRRHVEALAQRAALCLENASAAAPPGQVLRAVVFTQSLTIYGGHLSAVQCQAFEPLLAAVLQAPGSPSALSSGRASPSPGHSPPSDANPNPNPNPNSNRNPDPDPHREPDPAPTPDPDRTHSPRGHTPAPLPGTAPSTIPWSEPFEAQFSEVLGTIRASCPHFVPTPQTVGLARDVYLTLRTREAQAAGRVPCAGSGSGLLIEGPSGRGKDFVLDHVLRAMGYEVLDDVGGPPPGPGLDPARHYCRINAATGTAYAAVLRTMAFCRAHGLVLVVSELNLLPSEVIESLLCHLLGPAPAAAGDAHPCGHLPSDDPPVPASPDPLPGGPPPPPRDPPPGGPPPPPRDPVRAGPPPAPAAARAPFLLLATVNPSDTHEGRAFLRPEVQLLFTVLRIADYDRAELVRIARTHAARLEGGAGDGPPSLRRTAEGTGPRSPRGPLPGPDPDASQTPPPGPDGPGAAPPPAVPGPFLEALVDGHLDILRRVEQHQLLTRPALRSLLHAVEYAWGRARGPGAPRGAGEGPGSRPEGRVSVDEVLQRAYFVQQKLLEGRGAAAGPGPGDDDRARHALRGILSLRPDLPPLPPAGPCPALWRAVQALYDPLPFNPMDPPCPALGPLVALEVRRFWAPVLPLLFPGGRPVPDDGDAELRAAQALPPPLQRSPLAEALLRHECLPRGAAVPAWDLVLQLLAGAGEGRAGLDDLHRVWEARGVTPADDSTPTDAPAPAPDLDPALPSRATRPPCPRCIRNQTSELDPSPDPGREADTSAGPDRSPPPDDPGAPKQPQRRQSAADSDCDLSHTPGTPAGKADAGPGHCPHASHGPSPADPGPPAAPCEGVTPDEDWDGRAALQRALRVAAELHPAVRRFLQALPPDPWDARAVQRWRYAGRGLLRTASGRRAELAGTVHVPLRQPPPPPPEASDEATESPPAAAAAAPAPAAPPPQPPRRTSPTRPTTKRPAAAGLQELVPGPAPPPPPPPPPPAPRRPTFPEHEALAKCIFRFVPCRLWADLALVCHKWRGWLREIQPEPPAAPAGAAPAGARVPVLANVRLQPPAGPADRHPPPPPARPAAPGPPNPQHPPPNAHPHPNATVPVLVLNAAAPPPGALPVLSPYLTPLPDHDAPRHAAGAQRREEVVYTPHGRRPGRGLPALLEQAYYDVVEGGRLLAFCGLGEWHYTPTDYVTEVHGCRGTVTLSHPALVKAGDEAIVRLCVPGDCIPMNARADAAAGAPQPCRCRRLPNGGWYVSPAPLPAPWRRGRRGRAGGGPAPQSPTIHYALHGTSPALPPASVAAVHALYGRVLALPEATVWVDYHLLPELPWKLLRHIACAAPLLPVGRTLALLQAFFRTFFTLNAVGLADHQSAWRWFYGSRPEGPLVEYLFRWRTGSALEIVAGFFCVVRDLLGARAPVLGVSGLRAQPHAPPQPHVWAQALVGCRWMELDVVPPAACNEVPIEAPGLGLYIRPRLTFLLMTLQGSGLSCRQLEPLLPPSAVRGMLAPEKRGGGAPLEALLEAADAAFQLPFAELPGHPFLWPQLLDAAPQVLERVRARGLLDALERPRQHRFRTHFDAGGGRLDIGRLALGRLDCFEAVTLAEGASTTYKTLVLYNYPPPAGRHPFVLELHFWALLLDLGVPLEAWGLGPDGEPYVHRWGSVDAVYQSLRGWASAPAEAPVSVEQVRGWAGHSGLAALYMGAPGAAGLLAQAADCYRAVFADAFRRRWDEAPEVGDDAEAWLLEDDEEEVFLSERFELDLCVASEASPLDTLLRDADARARAPAPPTLGAARGLAVDVVSVKAAEAFLAHTLKALRPPPERLHLHAAGLALGRLPVPRLTVLRLTGVGAAALALPPTLRLLHLQDFTLSGRPRPLDLGPCPQLHDLRVVACRGFTDLGIASNSNLGHVRLLQPGPLASLHLPLVACLQTFEAEAADGDWGELAEVWLPHCEALCDGARDGLRGWLRAVDDSGAWLRTLWVAGHEEERRWRSALLWVSSRIGFRVGAAQGAVPTTMPSDPALAHQALLHGYGALKAACNPLAHAALLPALARSAGAGAAPLSCRESTAPHDLRSLTWAPSLHPGPLTRLLASCHTLTSLTLSLADVPAPPHLRLPNALWALAELRVSDAGPGLRELTAPPTATLSHLGLEACPGLEEVDLRTAPGLKLTVNRGCDGLRTVHLRGVARTADVLLMGPPLAARLLLHFVDSQALEEVVPQVGFTHSPYGYS